MDMIRIQEYHLGPAAEGGYTPFQASWKDFWDGINLYPIWSKLAWQDIRQRYRRSVIGPFWITISTAIMVFALGFLYAGLFHQEIHSYLPFLAIGLIVWSFVATILNEACTVFVNVENMMKQLRLPLTMHVCRMVWRNLIIFAHSIVIILILMIWGDITLSWELWFLPLATLLYCWNALNIGLLIGIVCTRFRDIGPLVANFVQLMFFVTPIMWNPQILTGKSGELAWIANYNPAYHFIEIFRAPLLGRPFPPYSWFVVLTATAILWILALWVMTKFRHRVTYWL